MGQLFDANTEKSNQLSMQINTQQERLVQLEELLRDLAVKGEVAQR